MTRCSVITDPISFWHNVPGHPECHARLEAVLSAIPADLPVCSATPASRKDVERIHDPHYLRWLGAAVCGYYFGQLSGP